MSTIVVGFIDNPEGHRALDLAIEEASRREARLVVVHSMEGGRRTEAEEAMAYRKAFEDVQARLTHLGVEHEVHEYVRGQTPAEDLLEAADEFGADLLVIGYRRRTAAGKALLGSHANKILLGADCPVLAIMAPE